mmetsp:Transcript_86773/g.201904  ORF Transcript_86773/g.201904 Transcript_86773/m.201904 type:complete len:201 (-) Transcript_86773:1119-1721(-)
MDVPHNTRSVRPDGNPRVAKSLHEGDDAIVLHSVALSHLVSQELRTQLWALNVFLFEGSVQRRKLSNGRQIPVLNAVDALPHTELRLQSGDETSLRSPQKCQGVRFRILQNSDWVVLPHDIAYLHLEFDEDASHPGDCSPVIVLVDRTQSSEGLPPQHYHRPVVQSLVQIVVLCKLVLDGYHFAIHGSLVSPCNSIAVLS